MLSFAEKLTALKVPFGKSCKGTAWPVVKNLFVNGFCGDTPLHYETAHRDDVCWVYALLHGFWVELGKWAAKPSEGVVAWCLACEK